jgi:hypothetical protein
MGSIRDEARAEAEGESPGPPPLTKTPPLALAGLAPQPVEVLGLRLGPMTLNHWATLQRVGSALTVAGKPITADEVLRAAALLLLEPGDALDVTEKQLGILMGELGAGLLPSAIAPVAEAINRCVEEAFATALPFKARGGDVAEKKALSGGSLSSSTRCWKPTGAA